MTSQFLKVVFPVQSQPAFTYLAGEEGVSPGWLVAAPLGRSQRVGVVWEILPANDCPEIPLRAILAPLGDGPVLSSRQLSFLSWIARYYMQPLGAAVSLALPSHLLRYEPRQRVVAMPQPAEVLANLTVKDRELVEIVLHSRNQGLEQTTLASRVGSRGLDQRLRKLAQQGLLRLENRWHCRQMRELATPAPPASMPEPPLTLTSEQEHGLAALREGLDSAGFRVFLLEGVTGSGKTELYLQATAHCLALGRQALVLVPEIALTPQLFGRFHARFPGLLAMFHSGMSDHERYRHWLRVREGAARVVIGARSALFAPFVHLGLVVVDEEHDSSYKQDAGGLPYHGRDMAVVLARQSEALLVLGSATPSLESLYNVQQGKYQRLQLTQRATGAAMPTVAMVDLRAAIQSATMTPNTLISPILQQAMARELGLGRQVLLFLDRRGYAPVLLCTRCGHTMGCRQCSVSLTYHREKPRLVCHYCGAIEAVPDYCPTCGQMSLSHFGPGTERLEKKVRECFPDQQVARLDRDVVAEQGADAMTSLLTRFQQGEIDILVGTRMIAKGHHFPNLSLVGVILADTGLFHPDFRGAERTFQTVTQVAGRAGREGLAGQVLVQSYDPGHYALTAAMTHDLAGFTRQELALRRETGYPPFARLALVRFLSQDQEKGGRLQKALRELWQGRPAGQILGPAPAHLFRLRNWYRWQILVREQRGGGVQGLVRQVYDQVTRLAEPGIWVTVDVDPYDFMS